MIDADRARSAKTTATNAVLAALTEHLSAADLAALWPTVRAYGRACAQLGAAVHAAEMLTDSPSAVRLAVALEEAG
uniref:Uncharacterized protein n=1 Tax=viral metagenome TaxID=1070528 RepID=A0A6M3LVN8_9ZZZZ